MPCIRLNLLISLNNKKNTHKADGHEAWLQNERFSQEGKTSQNVAKDFVFSGSAVLQQTNYKQDFQNPTNHEYTL